MQIAYPQTLNTTLYLGGLTAGLIILYDRCLRTHAIIGTQEKPIFQSALQWEISAIKQYGIWRQKDVAITGFTYLLVGFALTVHCGNTLYGRIRVLQIFS